MADRGLVAGDLTALGGATVETYNLVKLNFTSPLYYTDAPYDISYGGNTYVSSGVLLKVPRITESIQIKPNTITLKLSGVTAAVHALFNAHYRNTEVTIYRYIKSTGNAVPIFLGFMDSFSSSEDNRESVADISLKVANHWTHWELKNGRRITHDAQSYYFPGDDGFKFAGATDPVSEHWGQRNFLDFSNYVPPPQLLDHLHGDVQKYNIWLWGVEHNWQFGNYDWDAAKASNIKLPVIYGYGATQGVPVFRATSGTNGEYLWIVHALCEGEIDDVPNIFLDGTEYRSSAFSGLVDCWIYTGTVTQTADAGLVAASVDWTSACQLKGVAYVVTRIKYDQNKFQGEPTFKFIVRGRKCYDPRTATTVWTNNPAICLMDYLMSGMYGKAIPPTYIDQTSIEDAADYCDTTDWDHDAYLGGSPSVIKKYTIGGVLDTNKTIKDNMNELLFAMMGHLPWVGGKYTLKLEADRGSSQYSFDDDEIVGKISVDDAGIKETANRVVYNYTEPFLNHYVIESVTADSATYLSQDNNIPLEQSVGSKLILNKYQAKKYAFHLLNKSRQQKSITFESRSADALQVECGDIVDVTLDYKSWTNKTFMVTQVEIEDEGTCRFTLAEYDSTIFSFAAVQETPDVTPPAGQDPYSVLAPTGFALASGNSYLLLNADGTIVVRMRASWNKSADDFVDHYELFGKKSTESDYQLWGIVKHSDAAEFFYSPVEDGVQYNCRIYAVNTIGVRSTNIDLNHTVVGKSGTPTAPTSLADGSTDQNIVNLLWSVSPDADYAYTEIWSADVNNRADASFSLVESVPGISYNHGTSIDQYYWIRHVDTSGLVSAWYPSGATAGILGQPDGVSPLWDDITDKPVDSLLINNVGFTSRCETEDYALWTVPASNTLAMSPTKYYSGANALLAGNSVTAAYDANGVPNVTYIEIDQQIAQAFEGRTIRVTAFLAQPATGASAFAQIGYSAGQAGQSAWATIATGTTFAAYSFTYRVPKNTTAQSHYFAFDADWMTPAGDKTIIDNVVIEILPNQVFYSATAPTGGNFEPGDLWYDTSTFEIKRWSGSIWVAVGTWGADWEDNVRGTALPDSFYDTDLIFHDWAATFDRWTLAGASMNQGLQLDASDYASRVERTNPKWTWDANRYFSISFTNANAATYHSTTAYTIFWLGGIPNGSNNGIGFAFRRSGSVIQAFGVRCVGSGLVYTGVIATFGNGDNVRCEMSFTDATSYTVWKVFVNGTPYTTAATGTVPSGTTGANFIPYVSAAAASSSNYQWYISDFYFHQYN